jgi:4-amino-4-deoxy-L-arabinose transferase-like glycosyltransferase
MFQFFQGRAGHHVLLTAVCAALYLPNLGGPSLWDIDEGNNSACSLEMRDSGDWVVPHFNGGLRVDKPVLLYWLQLAGYAVCGVNEFGARLPSALAALATVLLTYELGRRLFDAATGLLGGVVLASATMFCAAAHFANPDALLCACTVLTFLCYWRACTGSRWWLVAAGAAAGLGVLVKGPVAIVVPCAALFLFLLLSRRLGLLWDHRIVWGTLACALVFAPWYALVGVETKAEFLSGFFLRHNVGRFLRAMEGHSGAPGAAGSVVRYVGGALYYPLVLLIGLAPWSAFLGLAAWYGAGRRARDDGGAATGAYRFLWCWVAAYLVFFSVAGTKLPNYVLPLYAPVVLLVARFLVRWRREAVEPGRGLLHAGLAGFAAVGVAFAVGLLVVGGVLAPSLIRGQRLPGVEWWSAAGALPLAGSAAAWWLVHRGRRDAALAALGAAAVLFLGVVAGWGTASVDASKAPRELVAAAQCDQPGRDFRVGCYHYFQPSLVFYVRRDVLVLDTDEAAADLLRYPVEVYLFLPAAEWERLQPQVRTPYRLVGRHRDLYRKCDVVVVTNR